MILPQVHLGVSGLAADLNPPFTSIEPGSIMQDPSKLSWVNYYSVLLETTSR
jgi:hypothetical protein